MYKGSIQGSVSAPDSHSWIRGTMGLLTYIAVAAGAGGAVVSAPFVLGAAGFTSVGIAAGSYAAGMMSTAAIANGGGVAAGSAVALLQSAGMAGMSGAATAAVASAGGTVGGLVAALV
ncbi:interferon alpha-inducible protein 27-like protein 2A [Cololabis saira]|uniref:interferon alpha-inducible protein 27-like protein 2A n=1 Tax=Cololabis saira TaxID=129043 RepID=UPI002AD3574B|nr:interferon alpha-inducible protein 27-like protein 2A [Cololabis saira]